MLKMINYINFPNICKFDYFELEKVSLNNENISKIQQTIKITDFEKTQIQIQSNFEKTQIQIQTNFEKIQSQINVKINKPSYFMPKEFDTLFWCYYILKNGEINYNLFYNKSTLSEKNEKINLVLILRENKNIIKQYKFDSITSIENNLANENLITKETFLSLCAIENINIIFVIKSMKNMYFELLFNENDNIYIIYELKNEKNDKPKYAYELATKELINNIRNTMYKLDFINKPLRTISYYKVSDLTDIAKQLNLNILNEETGKNKTKQCLYDAIYNLLHI